MWTLEGQSITALSPIDGVAGWQGIMCVMYEQTTVLWYITHEQSAIIHGGAEVCTA